MAMADPIKEIAAGMDEPQKEPKATEMGYFYLSQQLINITQIITDIRKEISDLRNNIDIRFDSQRNEIVDLRKEITDFKDGTISRFDNQRKEIMDLRKEITDFKDSNILRLDNQRKEFEQKINEFRLEMKEELKQEIGGLRIWSIGTIITVILTAISWYMSANSP
ncbi:hypothetical protein [Thermoanaerobacterium sp. DL9XJH110]|uniref:hypothetical protein n=1 Tax=Thermoanaerobacterium sp. DL9XJH110 TaxID=3386643 RepID=UPI003BB78B44